MPYQAPITVKSALDRIYKHEYVLPAIQREFVWKSEQICRLFDSLMQGFPVGSFLFWKIDTTTAKKFRFYDFVREYHQRDNPHCPPLGKVPDGPVTAVLDGQQRLTALNIGLRGTLAAKEPNKWWDNPKAFPVKQLYLNLLSSQEPDDLGSVYRFDFLTDSRASAPKEGEHWFPVAKMLPMLESSDPMEYLAGQGLGNNKAAVRALHTLQKIIHTALVINYYEEEAQDIEKVLNIFIRTNSGGTVLSYSDLLLSIATAQWEAKDARSEINDLVDDLNETGLGFNLSKDFVLKAGLMLSDIVSVGFKVENFDRENMKALESNWPAIAESLRLTLRLAAGFGLSRDTITADSALLPVAYYLHKKNAPANYLTSNAEMNDRAAIKSWIVRSLVKPGVWGSGLDVLLTALREVIRSEPKDSFPIDRIEKEMRVRGKDLSFSAEELEDLVDRKYGSRDVFALLTLMFSFIDTRNQFHIDHVFPRAAFHAKKLKASGMSPEAISHLQELKERMPNLQLLEGPANLAKGERMPVDWLSEVLPTEEDRKDYVARHLLKGIEADIGQFEADFYSKRRLSLLVRMKEVLNRK